jgi:hypothetical protein
VAAVLTLGLPLVISGCQSSGGAAKAYWLAPGSTMSLLVPVTIPANRTKVDLRLAAAARSSRTRELRCMLEVRNLKGSPQHVPVGAYVIEKTEIDRNIFVDERGHPHMLASNGLLLASQGPSNVLTVTSYYFQQGQPADLYRFACSRPGRRGDFLSVEQIESLLQDVISFTPKLQ